MERCLTNAEQSAKVIDVPPNTMTTTEAIIALRSASEARCTADKTARRAANKSFKVAALNLWNAWKAEGHPESATEILNAYGICFA